MRIFISCERQDRDFAKRLAKDLRSARADASVSTRSFWDDFARDYDYIERSRVAQRVAYHWLVGVLSQAVISADYGYYTYGIHPNPTHVGKEIDYSLSSPSASVVLINALPYHKDHLPQGWRDLPCFDATRDYQAALAKLLQHVGLAVPQYPRSSAGQVVSPAQVPHAQSARTQTSAGLTLFVSYSHQDDNFARRLISDLHTQGIGVWIDHERLTPGTADWDREIRRGIGAAKGVIYVASEDAAASPYVSDELAVARDNHVVVYPLWARGGKWSSCAPLGWGRTQYIDAREGKYEAAVRALVASILGSVGR